MKTYREEQKGQAFDWNAFLNKKNITEDEWYDAVELAKSWVTCACGNQCSIIPRDFTTGSPVDEKLKHLGGGYGFYGAIQNKNKKAAKQFLKKIEKRSTVLIAEEVAKYKKALTVLEGWEFKN
jgi:hypothetical protein